MRIRTLVVLAAAIFFWLVVAPSAFAVPLIFNGGFEAGFAFWTIVDQAGGSGSWFIDDADGFTPLSGMPTVGPASGLAYAVTDQTGPGAHVLLQGFTIAPGTTSALLTFKMFANDWDAGPIVDPSGLDYTSGGTFAPNQHARVDILTGAAAPFDTGPGVLLNFYVGVDPGADPNPYTAYAFDLITLGLGPGAYQLRFGEVDNQFFFNLGVDDVGIEAVVGVAEPAFLILLVSGIGAALVRGRHRCKMAPTVA